MGRITSLPIRLAAVIAAVMLTFASAQADEDSAELEQVREKIAGMFDTIEPERRNSRRNTPRFDGLNLG